MIWPTCILTSSALPATRLVSDPILRRELLVAAKLLKLKEVLVIVANKRKIQVPGLENNYSCLCQAHVPALFARPSLIKFGEPM